MAQSRQPHHQLQRINIVSNQNQLSLLLLNQLCHVVQTILHNKRSSLLLHRLSLTLSLGLCHQTGLLLSSSLRRILGQETEHFSSLVLVQGVLELIHSGRNLQTLAQHLTLSLENNVTRPLEETGQIRLVLPITPYQHITLP